jgi:hypothetical protein
MSSQSSRDIFISEEDKAQILELRLRSTELKNAGQHHEAWQCSVQAMQVLNRSTVHTLASGDFTSDELLMYCETPREEPAPNVNKGVILELALIKDSPLAREILAVLNKWIG